MDRVAIDPGTMSDGPRILEEDFDGLMEPVIDDEIKATLFDIDNDKAPGSDGFASFFVKSAWDRIGKDVCLAIKEFFASGRLLKQWNHAIIALVLKSPTANMVHDYRPISCCLVF